MSSGTSIGLRALESITWYTSDLSRKHRLLADYLGCRDAPGSCSQLDDDDQLRAMYQSGSCRFVCVAPRTEHSRAARYLARHPEGIGQLTFAVDDLSRARSELISRGATFVSSARDDNSLLELATPIDDLTFCFVQHDGGDELAYQATGTSHNSVGLSHFDHVTINTGTILPIALWLQHLLGVEEYWATEFHTSDLGDGRTAGSGLKSIVMWDPVSKIKFALNEPKRPRFFASQIELFRQDHRGSGVQHIAIHVHDLVEAVSVMKQRGVRFAGTPSTYYEQLQKQLDRAGVGAIDEPLETLRELGILADGSGPSRYLLQIFMEDDAAFLGGNDRSPFFIELIERKGCPEFGAGNFRALFESIERAQAGAPRRRSAAS